MTRQCCNNLLLEIEDRGFGGFATYEIKKNHNCQNDSLSLFQNSFDSSGLKIPPHLFDKTWVFYPIDTVYAYIKQLDSGEEGVFLLNLRETDKQSREHEKLFQQHWIPSWIDHC